MSADIENCPFCGSSNIAVGYHGQPAQTFHMRCVSCGAAGPTVNSSLPTGGAFPANVCESWNRRATPPAPTPAAAEGRAEPFAWIIARDSDDEWDGGESMTDESEAKDYIENRCLPGWHIEPLYRRVALQQPAQAVPDGWIDLIEWMLGKKGPFPTRNSTTEGLYWWRKELRARYEKLAGAAPGEPGQ